MFPYTPTNTSDELNWQALSAIGTLLAVLVALFQDPVRRWWKRPRLRFVWSPYYDKNPTQIGDRTRTQRDVHVIVKNKGREAAQRVEVVLAAIYQINEKTRFYTRIPGFIPTPLRWTHSNNAICEYLPRGEKLCDLGQHETWEPQALDDQFTFITATPRRFIIRTGLYVFRLTANALNADPASLTIVLRIGGPIPWVSNVPTGRVAKELRELD